MHNETFEVTDEYEEERLDKFLAAIYPEQSRSFFQKLIKDGDRKSTRLNSSHQI